MQAQIFPDASVLLLPVHPSAPGKAQAVLQQTWASTVRKQSPSASTSLLLLLLEQKDLTAPLFLKPNAKFNQQKIKQSQFFLIMFKKK